ncbi:hypothetical protein [Aquimarina litoralis]|uniref:hypothetical protein n=1 Tax=Aquimarina litoralis TaxID=584605 RepID=UPI001C58A9C0|nr:hypothetical protein [Aquimarina litoralis]MBW1298606.1 hypothetical protein [Aquimarina litoralis]
MYRISLCIFFLSFTVYTLPGQYTQIPDANFEAEIFSQDYDDISGDGQVPTALIEDVTSLDVSNKGIADLPVKSRISKKFQNEN